MNSAGTAEIAPDQAASAIRIPPEEQRQAWLVLFLLFTVNFFSTVDRGIFGILAQPIKQELLLTDTQLGILTGFAFSAVHLFFGFPMARLSDKGNRVAILSICFALWSVMTALCGLSANFIQLCLAGKTLFKIRNDIPGTGR